MHRDQAITARHSAPRLSSPRPRRACGLKLSEASMASSVPVGPHGWLRVAARARRSVCENGLNLPAGRGGSKGGQRGWSAAGSAWRAGVPPARNGP